MSEQRRRHFLKQLQPFGIEFSRHHRESGDVFTRMQTVGPAAAAAEARPCP